MNNIKNNASVDSCKNKKVSKVLETLNGAKNNSKKFIGKKGLFKDNKGYDDDKGPSLDDLLEMYERGTEICEATYNSFKKTGVYTGSPYINSIYCCDEVFQLIKTENINYQVTGGDIDMHHTFSKKDGVCKYVGIKNAIYTAEANRGHR